jgi:hypothetical protein
MSSSKEAMYQIPARYRNMENMHIIFWLLKDLSWCLIWKPLGIAMIFPTLIISIIIAWRTSHIKAELAHNLAISFWITANSYWMISEFFGFDETLIFGLVEGKYFAVIPFSIGVIILVYYYLFYKSKQEHDIQITTT